MLPTVGEKVFPYRGKHLPLQGEHKRGILLDCVRLVVGEVDLCLIPRICC